MNVRAKARRSSRNIAFKKLLWNRKAEQWHVGYFNEAERMVSHIVITHEEADRIKEIARKREA